MTNEFIIAEDFKNENNLSDTVAISLHPTVIDDKVEADFAPCNEDTENALTPTSIIPCIVETFETSIYPEKQQPEELEISEVSTFQRNISPESIVFETTDLSLETLLAEELDQKAVITLEESIQHLSKDVDVVAASFVGPKFLKGMESLDVVENEAALFEVKVLGSPKPNILWLV